MLHLPFLDFDYILRLVSCQYFSPLNLPVTYITKRGGFVNITSSLPVLKILDGEITEIIYTWREERHWDSSGSLENIETLHETSDSSRGKDSRGRLSLQGNKTAAENTQDKQDPVDEHLPGQKIFTCFENGISNRNP